MRVQANVRASVEMTAWLLKTAMATGAVALLTTCQYRPSTLDQVRRLGVPRVASMNSAATYYLGADGPRGFEYDLAKEFARQLGVKLKMVVVADRQALMDAVADGQAQLGAGLAVSAQRGDALRAPCLASMLRIDALRCSPGREQPETRCAQTSGGFIAF